MQVHPTLLNGYHICQFYPSQQEKIESSRVERTVRFSDAINYPHRTPHARAPNLQKSHRRTVHGTLGGRTKAKPLLELQVRLRATVSRKFNQWLAS